MNASTYLFPDNPRLAIVLPTYNEEERLPTTLDELTAAFGKNENVLVIISDDGSKDKTVEIAKSYQDRLHVDVHVREANGGQGAAVRSGILYALKEHQPDLLMAMDADLSVPLNFIQPLVTHLYETKAHITLGSRRLDTLGVVGKRSRIRSWGSEVVHWYSRLILRVPQRDQFCGFKLFTLHAARSVFDQPLTCEGWIYNIELLVRAHQDGLRIEEVPVAWYAQPGSKWRVNQVTGCARELMTVLYLRYRDVFSSRPVARSRDRTAV